MSGSSQPASLLDADRALPTPRIPTLAMTATAMTTTTLKVEGMTCGACTSAIESAFEGIEGVGTVSVSLVMERAVIVHDSAKLSPDQAKEMIEDRGFDAEVLSSDLPTARAVDNIIEEANISLMTTTVAISGMTCGACTSAVEGSFKNVAGIKSFSISLLSERAIIEHDPSIIAPEQIVEVIDDTGFDATIMESQASQLHKIDTRKTKILTTTVGIEGMTCGACTKAVTDGFDGVDGILQFNISLLAERAIVVHDPSKITEDRIAEIIDDCGFDAKIISSFEGGSQSSKSSSSVSLKIYGMSKAEHASDLGDKISAVTGITSVSINLRTTRAVINYKPTIVGLRTIVDTIEAAGFNALMADADDNNAQLESLAKTKEIQEWRRAFRTSLMFAVPVLLTSMILPMCIPVLDYGSWEITTGLWFGDLVCLALTVPVQFGIGNRFYVSAYKSMKHGSPTMDVLVVLGTSAAFFFSLAAMIVSIVVPPNTRPATVFDTSTMLITFITLGRYMENRAKGQTSKALSRLMSLAPSMTTIYADPIAAAKIAEGWELPEKYSKPTEAASGSSDEKVIPTELLELGDIVIIKPGDKVPADGLVIRGESYVDESMVTGEAMPIQKKKGSFLMAGTINGAGKMDFRVTRAGRDTQLSQIVRMVQEAQTSRAPIQRIADKVAGYFVPIIITLGLSTFLVWMVLSHVLRRPPRIFLDDESGGKVMVCVKLCISVIVFACPCALGLSTPTAIMVGTGVGAENGILVKGGAALETATKVNHVVLDKTGTLTVGKMAVSNSDILGLWKDDTQKQRLFWTLIGLAEMNSEHPIAKAIVIAAKDYLNIGPESALDGSVGDFEVVPGEGISAFVEAAISPERKRHRVLVGNAPYLKSQGIKLPDGADDEEDPRTTLDSIRSVEDRNPSSKSDDLRYAGTTTIYTAIANEYTGTISLADSLKPAARSTILALARLGISSSIVTGDTLPSALVVASQVGIAPQNVHASATPADKQRIIAEMGESGRVVAMVGDGINDSPALASAAVGIALASGTDVAMEAAGIVLMNANDLLAIPASLYLSSSIFRRIKMNLLWACGYNIIGLPFAMGFFLPWGYHLHPMAAGAAMACSSVSVVASSLALKWWRRPKWMSVEQLDPAAAELMDRDNAGEIRPERKLSLWQRVRGTWSRKQREEEGYVPLQNMSEV
ncbi:heavy metal translocatin [Pseudovirgaria hyperparasitica]|uniref:P-type Cu(+) transporter n=1 Tax=Pseudovirgaria hyperparasitica TaxID=470096 RepID=A0A6A6WA67_9PEZI|nr:heavy metal translocatin [Pseudovirgaria hyperparasitica]KAF2758746.1 heavy metal translocatin [Pseudovirgaria hyperparasitica]